MIIGLKDLGKILKEIREKANLTQKELAKRVGMKGETPQPLTVIRLPLTVHEK